MQTTLRRPAAATIAPRCPVAVADLHCPRTAGFGTDHPGHGKCRQHELESAAAARAAASTRVPPAVFQEPVYVDGLTYQETAPAPLDSSDEAWDDAA